MYPLAVMPYNTDRRPRPAAPPQLSTQNMSKGTLPGDKATAAGPQHHLESMEIVSALEPCLFTSLRVMRLKRSEAQPLTNLRQSLTSCSWIFLIVTTVKYLLSITYIQ